MKKDDSHSFRLGMTQWEMCALLGVHPSQWSMFESRKRSLPIEQMVLLFEMLKYVREKEAQAEGRLLPTEAHQKQLLTYMERRQVNITCELILLQQKKQKADRKQLELFRRMQLAEYLRSLPQAEDTPNALPNAIRVPYEMPNHGRIQFDLERERVLLEFEEKWLAEKLAEVKTK